MPRATGKAGRKKAATRTPAARKPAQRKYWSAEVTAKSSALDLENHVFALPSAEAIAHSLKRSADESTRRKAGAFQSAMSMLNFYINRAGRNLPEARKRVLNAAKEELRKLYGRT